MGRGLVLAFVALALAACTPEQQTAVINDYAQRMSTESEGERGPSWIVDATCDHVHLVTTGYPDGSWLTFGVGSAPPYGTRRIKPAANVDFVVPTTLSDDSDLVWSLLIYDSESHALVDTNRIVPCRDEPATG